MAHKRIKLTIVTISVASYLDGKKQGGKITRNTATSLLRKYKVI